MSLLKSARIALPLAIAAATTGCKGAKYSCEGTLEVYAECINKRDWECVANLVHPNQRERFTDKTIEAWAANEWADIKDLSFDSIQVDESWNIAQAHTTASFYKVNKGRLKGVGGTYACLPAKGGKWYLSLPGVQK